MKPRIPWVRVHEIVKEEGKLYAQPLTPPVCDFCLDVWPKWEYGCADFILQEIPDPYGGPCWASANGWLACEECARLIDENRTDELMTRKISAGLPFNLNDAFKILHGFFEHKDGSKKPFG